MSTRLLIALTMLSGVARADVDAAKLAARTAKDRLAYKNAVSLADEVGARAAGSPGADKAVTWALAALKAAGLANVHPEPVTLEPWHRGPDDRVEVVAPYKHALHMLALGNSPGTPTEGITAPIVAVDSFDALHRLGEAVRGKIVFYDERMKRQQSFEEYGRVGAMRFRGAVEAARLGAIGAIIRSVGTGYHRLPHGGATGYDDKVDKIPFAAIAAEDADLLDRALARGPVKVSMKLGCGRGPAIKTSNVVGEVRGQGKPDEIVLLGAHLDSWDVGDGAIDDGAGVGIVIEAAQILASLHPKRTIRVVLYMNEENGLDGAKAYAQAHAAELPKHFAAIESDSGAGNPIAWGATTEPGGDLLRKWVGAWSVLGVDKVIVHPHLGSDTSVLTGVPNFAVAQDGTDYFEWHHTNGDTADKIDPAQIERAAAAVTTLAAQLAGTSDALPRAQPPASH